MLTSLKNYASIIVVILVLGLGLCGGWYMHNIFSPSSTAAAVVTPVSVATVTPSTTTQAAASTGINVSPSQSQSIVDEILARVKKNNPDVSAKSPTQAAATQTVQNVIKNDKPDFVEQVAKPTTTTTTPAKSNTPQSTTGTTAQTTTTSYNTDYYAIHMAYKYAVPVYVDSSGTLGIGFRVDRTTVYAEENLSTHKKMIGFTYEVIRAR